jgi:hypothetical protein
MCQTVSASTQRKSFEAAAKGFFPDYMISFRDKPVDVPRGPPPQRRINIFKYKQNAGRRFYEIFHSIIARNIRFSSKFTKNEIGV